MIPYDEVMLMSLFATTKQKSITQQISTSYRLENPEAAKAAISDAAWKVLLRLQLIHTLPSLHPALYPRIRKKPTPARCRA